jgi:alkylation response protein AidB-like acyl-CoA dehydrogenase
VVDAITFAKTDEQTMLGSTVCDFLEATVDFDAVREMSTTNDALDTNVWNGLAEMGLIGLHIPEKYGGAGFGATEVGIVFQELGRTIAAVPLLSSVLASTAILGAGTDEQKNRLLPEIASGETVATLAVYEDAHHAYALASDATLTKGEGGWVLKGLKRYVTDAPNAGVFVVSALTPDGVALAVVSSDTPGVSITPTNSLDATRPLGEVAFDGVRVGEGDVMIDAAGAIAGALDMGAVCLAAEQVGGAQWCLETSVEYAKNRYQFGRAIGSFQAIKHMCADMLVAVEHARSVAWHAAATIEDAKESAIAVPLARSVCSDAYVKAAGDTIQILGGIGFTWEHEAHLYFKRAKSTSLLLGSVDSYRDRLADAIGI